MRRDIEGGILINSKSEIRNPSQLATDETRLQATENTEGTEPLCPLCSLWLAIAIRVSSVAQFSDLAFRICSTILGSTPPRGAIGSRSPAPRTSASSELSPIGPNSVLP